jgi:hypothetical protein
MRGQKHAQWQGDFKDNSNVHAGNRKKKGELGISDLFFSTIL